MCVCHMCAGIHGNQETELDPLELKLPLSHLALREGFSWGIFKKTNSNMLQSIPGYVGSLTLL